MDRINSVAVPLGEIVCEECCAKSTPDGGSHEIFLPYQAHTVQVDGGADSEPVSVTLDVQKLVWRQVAKGRCAAEATFLLPCPACEQEHEFHHKMSAPSVFLTQLGTCKSCDGPLELQDEFIEYLDDPATGPSIEVKGHLVCEDCSAVTDEQRAFPSPDLASLRSAGDLNLVFDESKIQKRTQEDQGRNYRFDAALTFSGKHRAFVQEVAEFLIGSVGQGRIFYDELFEAELARPNLDTYLQQIYRDDSRLVVVFLSESYARSDWCGLEWRAVRDILKSKAESSIMLLRFDPVEIPGLFAIDGYVNLIGRPPEEVAQLISRRLDFEFGGLRE